MSELVFSENIRSNVMPKGSVKVQLFDKKSGCMEFEVSKDNLILSKNISRLWQIMVQASMIGSLSKTVSINQDITEFFRAVYLSELSSDPNEETELPLVEKLLGYARRTNGYTGPSTRLGSINISESFADYTNNKLRFVFDWPSNSANGIFQSVGWYDVCFTSSNVCCAGLLKPGILRDFPVLSRSSLWSAISSAFSSLIKDLTGRYVLLSAAGGNLPVFLDTVSPGSIVPFANTLKSPSGVTIAAWNARTHGDKLYAYTTDNKLTVWNDNSDLQGVNASANYTLPIPSLGSFDIIDDNTIIMASQSPSIDPVVGAPYNKYLYEINLTTLSVTRRILRFDSANEETYWPNIVPALVVYYPESSLLKVFSLHHSSTTSRNFLVEEVYDYASEDDEKISTAISDGSFVSSRTIVTMSEVDGIPIVFANSGTSSSVQYNTHIDTSADLVGFYSICDNHIKQSRVVLPAPVTKLNTQTLKVTYDLVWMDDVKM